MAKSNTENQLFNTKAIHTGSEHCPVTGAHIAPVYRTSTFVMKNAEEAIAAGYGDPEGKHYAYTRYGNPTVHAVQRKIAALENAEAALMAASGMGAITTALMAVLSTGDHIVAADTVYGGTFGFMKKILPRFGIEVTMVRVTGDSVENIRNAMKPNTKIVYVETPCNPTLAITDLKRAAEIAHEGGALLYVDNTFATPYLQQPISLGADIVLHSTTKYLNGHGDMIGGAIVGSKALIHHFDSDYLKWIGGVMSPADAAGLSKGIKTLGVRMEVHCANAKKVAEFLEHHDMVEKVLYPGLESHPGHEIAKKQMKDFGGMMSFNVRGGFEAGKLLMDSVKLFSLATSLGNVDSLIQHSASMSHASLSKEERESVGIADGQVRLSIGIEDVADIINDLDQGLHHVKKELCL
ncbi:trans-sulfuration enzyme family protein [Marinisporobacter balticus]|uniref:L-methionine gamma-lyase n=1 Tax=Marinisporobacter balticus TaxID=2018667 RepID=A0A4R2KFR4_9FIRM|nr:PLP-dependent aspartate aminotransferase family protein [Marinisporobacter balticus]TCO69246.1 methionine-gamma-lyase [Marinisporobacter balticus]